MKLTANEGTAFLITDEVGDVTPGSEEGLYQDDTRFLSLCRLRVGGSSPVLLSARAVEHYELVHYLTNPALDGIDRATLTIVRRRLAGDGMHEDVDVTNHGPREVEIPLELAYDADFAHVFLVKRLLQQPAEAAEASALREVRPDPAARRLEFVSRAAGASRRSVIDFSARPELDGNVARFAMRIPPGRTWHLCIDHQTVGTFERAPRYSCMCPGPPLEDRHAHRERKESYAAEAPALASDSYVLEQSYRRAGRDIAALRITAEQLSAGEFVIAAGIPWFLAMFGRDTLIATYQVLPFLPGHAGPGLRALARYQGTRVDRDTDEEPGKILHEHRLGAAPPRLIPRFPYYGSVDATPLFLIALSETVRWTGDRALLEELREPALRALEWIDRFGDRDGDGYVEYERTVPGGLTNQGWKDSGDSVRFRDGTPARAPIALCEVQGYVYDAKVRTAELLDLLGESGHAARLRVEAADLRERFDRDFWLADRGTFALALDADKRPVDALTSNPGHLLWSGIAMPERASQLAATLLDSDLFSGWGIRTMGKSEGGYSPISYHNGTVWPHDNSLIALGFARYGLRDEASRIVGAMIDALGDAADDRLPELFAGYGRDETPFPVEYPTSCRPQAWAAGAVMLFVRTLLGAECDIHGRLTAAPVLPPSVGRLRATLVVHGDPVTLEARRTARGVDLEAVDDPERRSRA